MLKIQKNNYTVEQTGIDPFRVAITIASLCNFIYRSKFMKSKSIRVIPDNGYNPKNKTSNKCRIWLSFLKNNRNILIQDADNGEEKRC
jgi:hypothetical protein